MTKKDDPKTAMRKWLAANLMTWTRLPGAHVVRKLAWAYGVTEADAAGAVLDVLAEFHRKLQPAEILAERARLLADGAKPDSAEVAFLEKLSLATPHGMNGAA